MNFIVGKDRHQIEFKSLEDNISSNNPVRFMDQRFRTQQPRLTQTTNEAET